MRTYHPIWFMRYMIEVIGSGLWQILLALVELIDIASELLLVVVYEQMLKLYYSTLKFVTKSGE